jgi:hypothetical protein
MVDTCVIDAYACMLWTFRDFLMMCIIANDVYLANDVYFAVILVIACIFYVYA